MMVSQTFTVTLRLLQVTAYHYESKSGTPRDYSNYNPETYVGDYTNVAPRRVPHPDVEVTRPLSKGEDKYQSLYDVSEKGTRQWPKTRDPQVAGTEDDAEYDYYGGGGEEEGDGGEGDYEGGGYEGESEGGSEADYYY